MRGAYFRRRFGVSCLRARRDSRRRASVQFQFWACWCVGRGGQREVPEFLVKGGQVRRRRGRRCGGSMFAWAQLGKCLFADLDSWTSRPRQLLELNNIRQIRKNFWGLGGRSGIDQRLPRMVRMCRVSEDALAGMESVSAFLRERFFRLAARTGLGFGTLRRQERQIGDRPRPGEFRVVERGIVAGRSLELREGHEKKSYMPQRRGNQGTAGNASLHPAVLEKTFRQKILGNASPGENGANAASDALMKTSPSKIQLRFMPGLQAHGSGRRGSLSQEVQCPADLAQRQFPFFKNKPRRWLRAVNGTGLKTRHYKQQYANIS